MPLFNMQILDKKGFPLKMVIKKHNNHQLKDKMTKKQETQHAYRTGHLAIVLFLCPRLS